MRRQLVSASTLAAALLLSTACAGDDGSSADDLPGVDATDREPDPETDDEAAPPDDDTDRPDVRLPDDMNNVFEDTETGDPTKDEIIADVTRGIESIDLGFAESDPNHEAMEFYYIEDGRTSSSDFIRRSAEENLSWAGTGRYYDFEVDNDERRSTEPLVGYCIDTTEIQTKDLETDTLLPKPDDPHDIMREQVVVRQNDEGVWQITTVLPPSSEEDATCEP